MGTPQMIREVAEIVSAAARKEGIAVVVSAFQGVTDQLLRCAQLSASGNNTLRDEVAALQKRHIQAIDELVKNKKSKAESMQYIEAIFNELKIALIKISDDKKVSNKNLDLIASFGERLSAYIVATHLKTLPAMSGSEWVDARELVKTNDNFVNAEVDFSKTNRNIQNFFSTKSGFASSGKNKKGIPVITGFLGSTEGGITTTLGRGGSDYSGAIFGAALDVKAIEIWTDVDGVMSADPRIVKSAVVLPEVSYEEAIEMAYFGAKVIHPATMLPAIKKSIPVVIKNTFNPSAPGTWIRKEVSKSSMPVKGITGIDDVTLINVAGLSLVGIPGSAARVFQATARAKANVILISQASSEHTICFAIKSSEVPVALRSLDQEFSKELRLGTVQISTLADQAVLAMVGDGMRGVPGIAGNIFRALGNSGVNISAIAQGGSERNISFAVSSKEKVRALNSVHNAFFENNAKNIFLIGIGNIGGVLLRQIGELQKRGDAIRVCGIMDAHTMAIDTGGIKLQNWKNILTSAEEADMDTWVARIKELQLPNAVFVDCTASEAVIKRYIDIAEAGFHIVTPNKKFNVLPMQEYKKLREVMAKNKKQFRYETNVGAALPIISTLNDLLASGDRIVKIEGIFSGTLGYIFSSLGGSLPVRQAGASGGNNFNGPRKFSEVVLEAKNLGYTEPDPREDLNGNDVGRKLLVLAREIGMEIEMKDVKIEDLVPEKLRSAKTAEIFLNGLPDYDKYFDGLIKKAHGQNKVLRYVAELGPVRGREGAQRASASNGMALMARASLKAVSLNDPLASTRGADNIFAIYTTRYNNRPLVIQGPGAGAEVTAAGVLADILRIMN